MREGIRTFFATNTIGRRLSPVLVLLAVSTLLSATAQAQVSVTATAGTPGPTVYSTLKLAFDALNAGTHQGVITISVTADTDETALTAVLNASGAGAASYTSVAITPVGARTITGATTAGNPLIDLNGADNVTIDGLNTGGNSLTISNTTVSATSGTSTIRFQTDATNNTITNASILGSSTMATTTNGGTIWFGAAAVTTGNDGNTISGCNVGPAGANLPTKAIYGNGSTTTTVVYNSGITLTNNNIFDFFNPAAQSNGIYVGGGNTDWVITNNRFYQTATRTQTTGALHSAIQAASATGNNNHNISGNVIGYSSAAGTGTYTFVGIGTGSKFLPIYFSGAGTTTASSIQGNTITAINLSGVVGGTSTTGAFVGISINSGLASIGNTTGNTIGSATVPGAISITSNNASAMEVFGIYYFPSAAAVVSNNVVGGITVTNSGAGSLVFYGIRAFTSSAVTNTMQNNTVGAASAPISNTSASTASRTIGLYCQSGACVVTGNTISNLSMSAANVGTGSTASLIGLWIDDTSATVGNNVSQNTVRSLSNGDPAAAVWVTGLQYNGATTGTHTVQRNLIHTLSTPSTSATATVNGINVQGGLTTFQNNMVVLGNDMTANSPQINGINETIAGTDNVYHNSVYIGGSGVAAGTASSFAFQSAITLNTRNYRDNIFVNARSNGAATSKHYAIRVGGTAANPSGLTSNNNVLYAPGTGGFTGLFNAVDQANLAAWQAATGQDSNSFALDPKYLAPTAATPNLHIDPTVTTVIEGNGVAIATVTDDYDGQTRSTLTPTDIGADAGNFIGSDLTPPAITYSLLGSTSLTTNRSLTATLTDGTGVASAALAPRIYYRKGAGAYFSQACSLSGGTAQSGTWNCAIVNSDMGGVVVSDVISYFLIAQDTLGNLASNPAGAVATNVNTVTTPPAAPNTYTIVTAYTGSYNVGSAETYTSLTNTGGIFEALNAGAATGNITINITSDLAAELGTVALNQLAEDGAGGYTLTIRPSGAPRTITGSNAGALIKINGADGVTIDGSTTGATAVGVGGDPALRELTIQNTNAGTSAVVIAVQSGTSGAQNDTIRNVNVLGQDPATTLVGIALGGAAPGTTGTDNDGNRVENCSVRRAVFGIYSAGASLANQNAGTVVTRNDLSATGADRVRRVGILVFNESGIQITENSVGGIDTSESADAVGIGVGTQAVDSTTTASGSVTGALVSKNRVNGVASTSATGFSASGIAVAGGAGDANVVVNNFVSGVNSPATSPDLVAGIFVVGATGSSTRLLHNSVSMTGDRGVVAAQMPSFSLAVTGTDPTVELKDNIFHTTQTSSGGGVNAKSYAIGMVTPTFANLDSNFNDFYASGVNAGFFRSGSLGAGVGTDYAALAAWQTAVSDDASSLQVDPLFRSATTDLHLLGTSPLLGTGTPIAGVTSDFDNDPRPAASPDMGADEVVQAVAGLIPAGTFYNARGANFDNVAGPVTITNEITLAGILYTGSEVLSLGCSASVTGAGATNYVDGNLRKSFCATGLKTFEVGAGGYSPVDVNITAGVPADFRVRATQSFAPGIFPTSNAIQRFWALTATGVTADLTFTYLDADLNALNESNLRVFRKEIAGSFTDLGGTINAGANTAAVTGATTFSEWTLALAGTTPVELLNFSVE